MDPNRRSILATGAVLTAAATAPRVFAQQAAQGALQFYQKGDVRIRFREVGSGFPLLATPGGGLDSKMSNWDNAVINAMEAFKNDFRVITMDQRNATGGESTGPVPVEDPCGNCIGGSFALKLMERAPDRIVAGVLSQPIGHRPENPEVMYNSGRDSWAKAFRGRRPDVSQQTIDQYLHNLYLVRPDFVYSVSREFVRNCQTPMLVLPDDTAAHAYQTAIDVASLAPNAEVSVYPWKDPPELKARTITRVRNFLKAHLPATAAR